METVGFSTKSGQRIEGALCEPTGAAPRGAVVIVHEWHGLNDAMKLQCERFAHEGYLAFVPDLFHGSVASDDAQAAALMERFDFQRAVAEIAESVAFVRAHPQCNGRVAVVGFCLGGALTLAAARYVPSLDAAVPFYGLPRFSPTEFAAVKTPICGHYAKVDAWANPAVAREIQGVVQAGGGEMELHVYEAEHAFMRSTDPSRYEPVSAALAWQRTMAFLQRHLR